MENNVIDKIKEILGLTSPSNEVVVEPTIELDVNPTETAATDPNAPVDTTTPSSDVQTQIDNLSSMCNDLNSRLTILEGMMMKAQKQNEKLSAIVEVISNQPSGEPIQKLETAEEIKMKVNVDKETKKRDTLFAIGKLSVSK